MSEEWQVLSLADAGVTLLDCDHKTPEAVDSGWPYVGIPQMTTGRVDFSTARRITHADFIAWTRKTKYQKDDVILSRRTNPGVTAIDDTGTEFALGQNLVLLRADGRKVYPPFLRWLVRGPEWWVQIEKFINVGAVFSSLRCRDVPNFELTIPPLPEQRAIAATLGALDDKIELNRKMNATLEAMARALFRDWFVEFGPTRAKMETRAPYLTPDLWSLFPALLDDEDKPEGWEVSTIGDFIELLDHKRVPLSSQERAKRQGPYPYHGATSVMDHIDSYLFDERLLLLGEDGSVAKEDGRPFTQYVWGKLWVNNHAHVIKGRNMSVEQLKLFFDQIDIRPFVTGAVQPKLNQANLRRVPYLRASDAIHSAFDATIAPLYDLVRQLNEESRTLAQTRDLLLPRLMSGELRVAEAERAVEAAL